MGDHVRLSQRVRPFKKSYLPQWTEEVFVVSKVMRGPLTTCRVKEMDDTPVEGTFYEQDFQPISGQPEGGLISLGQGVTTVKLHFRRLP